MCGRFAIVTDIKDIFAHYGFNYSTKEKWSPQYNFSPSNSLPIVTGKEVQVTKWGFMHKNHFVINIRSEGYFSQSPMFSPCLIPADGYFEWQNKIPFYFQRIDKAPMLFAGFIKEGSFAIITKEADDDFAHIHHRMPAIIPDRDSGIQFLKTRDYPNRIIELTYKEVNPIVNSSKTNSPLSIQEVPQKQLRFF